LNEVELNTLINNRKLECCYNLLQPTADGYLNYGTIDDAMT